MVCSDSAALNSVTQPPARHYLPNTRPSRAAGSCFHQVTPSRAVRTTRRGSRAVNASNALVWWLDDGRLSVGILVKEGVRTPCCLQACS